MPTDSDYLPTATPDMLRLRARLLQGVRRYFDARGYLEVDTPLLSHERVVDPHLEPFFVDDHSGTLYMQTSPEFCMKRLLAAGMSAIYQIGHVFRSGERGRLHNPEFTMLEWYRVGDSHVEQMRVVEELVAEVFQTAADSGGPPRRSNAPPPTRPFLRTTYQEAFLRHAGVNCADLARSELARLAHERGVAFPASLDMGDRDGWLNLLLAELIEPHLGIDRPEFLHDYPASQAALARIRPGTPPVAERFELYIEGIEICNGYHELTDASELRRRIDAESQRRSAAGHARLPTPTRLLAAL